MSNTIRRIAGAGAAVAAAAALSVSATGAASAIDLGSLGSLDVMGSLGQAEMPENGILPPEITYKVDGNEITATVTDPNTPGEGESINCVVGVFDEENKPTDGLWPLNMFNEVVGGNVEGTGWAQTRYSDDKTDTLTTNPLDDGTYYVFGVCGDTNREAGGQTAIEPIEVTIPAPAPSGSSDILGSLTDLLGAGSSE